MIEPKKIVISLEEPPNQSASAHSSSFRDSEHAKSLSFERHMAIINSQSTMITQQMKDDSLEAIQLILKPVVVPNVQSAARVSLSNTPSTRELYEDLDSD